MVLKERGFSIKIGWLVVSMMLLISCQHTMENKEEQKISDKKKNDAVTYNVQLGLAYLKHGNHPRAKKKLLKALDQDPSSPEANGAMGFYMENSGDNKQAHKYYQKALSLAPKSGAHLNNYGTFLCKLGNYQESIKYFLKAVEDVHYINSAGAYENAGLCAEAIPDEKQAVEYFIKAVAQDPAKKQSLFELINIKLKASQPDQALSYLAKYSETTLSDKTLIELAIEAAKQANKPQVEQYYIERMAKLATAEAQNGEINDDNNNRNG